MVQELKETLKDIQWCPFFHECLKVYPIFLKLFYSVEWLNLATMVALTSTPLIVMLQMWNQQDGAQPHFNRIVVNYDLNQRFENRWIGRGDRRSFLNLLEPCRAHFEHLLH